MKHLLIFLLFLTTNFIYSVINISYAGIFTINNLKFQTFDEAKNWVKNNYKCESVDTSQKSSWIRAIHYFYADGQGFLIINMKEKEYIFKGVPKYLWEEFKVAPSYGKFYHQFIKGKYYFYLQ